ncbi:hypothetical protein FGG08_002876 [Glutinoglossum americanum]|uniref:Amidoligase enzyme-domain-containing protein n=1 Tax=Glutinoglossum americanum TaxID=1670608 RepID=A0A9P8L441_9PEZI|nr:hypothetical protein FGG08_002876 [Glutinoglossum americanum]
MGGVDLIFTLTYSILLISPFPSGAPRHTDPIYEVFTSLIFSFTAYTFTHEEFIHGESGDSIACEIRTLILSVLTTIGLAIDLDTGVIATILGCYFLWGKEVNAIVWILYGLLVKFLLCDLPVFYFAWFITLTTSIIYTLSYLLTLLRRYRVSCLVTRPRQGRRGALDLTVAGIYPLGDSKARRHTNRTSRASAKLDRASASPTPNTKRSFKRSAAPSPDSERGAGSSAVAYTEQARRAELPSSSSSHSGRLGQGATSSPRSMSGPFPSPPSSLLASPWESEDEDAARPFRLTFGVELEFILQYANDEIQTWIKESSREFNDDQTDTFLHCQIADALNAAGVTTYDPQSNRPKAFHLWALTNDDSVGMGTPMIGDQNCYKGVELKSPIYDANESNVKETIHKAIKTLHKNFEVFVNNTCGLHVHVGNRQDGFTLKTLKKLATLLLVFEPQLNSLHPWRRVTNRWCEAPRMNETFFEMTSREKAEYIDKVKSMRELIGAMSGTLGNRSVAYNFISLITMSTIEFRIHSGSLDADEVTNWVYFVTGLVNYAEVVDDVDIYKMWEPSSYTILDVMRMIGRPRLIDYYKDRLYDHTNPPVPEGPISVKHSSFTIEDLEAFNRRQGRRDHCWAAGPKVPSTPPSEDLMSLEAGSQDGISTGASRSPALSILSAGSDSGQEHDNEEKSEARSSVSVSSSMEPMESDVLKAVRRNLPAREFLERRYTYADIDSWVAGVSSTSTSRHHRREVSERPVLAMRVDLGPSS